MHQTCMRGRRWRAGRRRKLAAGSRWRIRCWRLITQEVALVRQSYFPLHVAVQLLTRERGSGDAGLHLLLVEAAQNTRRRDRESVIIGM